MLFLVLCDTWILDKDKSKDGEMEYHPHPDNTRIYAVQKHSLPIVGC